MISPLKILFYLVSKEETQMNNNYFGNGYMGQGMIPNQYQNGPKTGNWLSPEKLAMLRKGMTQFKLSVTEDEMAKGQCNHYDPQTGISALIPDQDGSGGCSCRLCGTHFNTKNYSTEEVHDAVQNILDILNTIKIMYLSIDPAHALEFFQILPFIEKIPQLYNIAVNDFKKYEGVDQFSASQAQNPFNIFAMMTNPGMGMGMAQPMYANQVYGQQPMMNAGMAQAQGTPAYNPMYGAPAYGQQVAQPQMAYAQQPVMQGGYQPQTQGYVMNPTGAAQPQMGQPAYGQQPVGQPQMMYANTNMPNAMNPTGAVQPQQVATQPVAQAQGTPAPAPAVDGPAKVTQAFKK
jgi:hypothetical protein